MNEQTFDSPVFVENGHFTIQISNLMQAAHFLRAWPENRRNGFHEIAVWAVTSGLDGRMTLASARDGFAHWAKTAGILSAPRDLNSVPLTSDMAA